MKNNRVRLSFNVPRAPFMKPQALIDLIRDGWCPRCGNSGLSTMAELRDLVSKPSSQFSSDLADWLVPPQRPVRPASRRHHTALRNSIAFGIVWMFVFSAACFALSGSPPPFFLTLAALVVAVVVGFSNWRSESKLAAKEDSFLLSAHWERYRAFLQRRRVWTRLRYCSKCALAIDPVTKQTASLYEVHELANSKVRG